MALRKIKILFLTALFLNYLSPLPLAASAEGGSLPEAVSEDLIMQEPVQEDPLALIESGEAELSVEAENNVNNNDLENQSPGEEGGVIANDNDSDISNDLEGRGDSGGNLISASGSDAMISTGGIESGILIDNQANTSRTGSFCQDACPDASSTDISAPDTAGATATSSVSEETASTSLLSASTTVSASNSASTTNSLSLGLDSGGNVIENSGDAAVETGDIGIINIIINYINSSFFGQGKEFFMNIFNTVADSLDLSGFGQNDPGFSGGDCSGDCRLAVNNSSTSTLANKILIDANTGANLIASSSGQATIETGDISVVNDVLNIANLNVGGDNWFFAVVNIFGELEGDIILPPTDSSSSAPAASSTIAAAAKQASSSDKTFIVGNENAAEVVNDIVVNADTGGNGIASSAESYVYTGSAEIKNTMFNLVNYNISGNSWKFARVNVFGDWQGFIQGLPEGYSYLEDGTGITVYNSFLDNWYLDSEYAQLLINNKNTATTVNDIEINAVTGQNRILNSSGEAMISSGDIDIANNLLNFINSNFSGDNWEFSMVNVFGQWQGNLSFGQPELWIVESFDQKGEASPGEYVTYTFMFGNNGDANASNVVIEDSINPSLVSINEAGSGEKAKGSVIWELGDLPPNTQGTISYVVQVKEDIPYGQSRINNQVNIKARENERDYRNNTSSGLVMAHRYLPSANRPVAAPDNPNPGSAGGNSSFTIIKTNNASLVLMPGDVVDYQIRIKNTGSRDSYEVLVLDVLQNQDSGEEIHREFWDLETVFSGEEIIIDYSLKIQDNIASGVYNNEVIIEGYDQAADKYISAAASSKIKVENNSLSGQQDEVLVLGEQGEPELSARKIWPEGVFFPGDEIDYQIVLRNDGSLSAYNVTVEEILPEELVFSNSRLNGQTFFLGDFGPGMEKSLPVKARVLEAAPAGEYETTTLIASANYETIKLGQKVVIDRVAVLAATGFEINQLWLITILLAALFASSKALLRRSGKSRLP